MSNDFRLIIHAGAPKCGSSALQTALSHHPDITGSDGTRYAYCAVTPSGDVHAGDEIRRRAMRSAFGYVASCNHPTEQEEANAFKAAAEKLARLREARGVPILSSESWAYQADRFRESGLVAAAGGGAHVILFIRPPVDWINSAWWQWGVWSAPNVDRFLRRAFLQTRWHAHAAAWAKVEGVARVTLRLAADDVVGRFFRLLPAPAPAAGRENSGIPPAFLSFLLRNRSYRDTAHTPQVEFIVARHLQQTRAALLWCLSHDHVRFVFENTPYLPGGVHALLEADDRSMMKDDPRWWSPEAYAARSPTDLETFATPDALIGLHADLMAPIGPVGRLQLIRSGPMLRRAARRGDLAAADREIARVIDHILVTDFRRRLVSAGRPPGARPAPDA
jgi:hypothetical protein